MEYTYIHNHQSQFIEWFGNVTETTSLSSLIAESYPGEWGKEAKNNNGVKVLRTTNFQNNGHIDYSDVIVRYIEQKKIEKKCLRTGDIILERSGGTKDNPVGRVVLFEAEGEYMFNNFTQLLRPIKSVNPYYLFFYLHTSYNADKASMRAMASQTTGIQNLNMTDYMAKEIPLPSLEEQEQFERLYRQADKSKFDGFKSQFIEWFGDVEYIPLKNVCLRIGEYGSNTPATDYDGSVRYLRITDINDDGSLGNEIVSPSTIEEKYYLQTNDFVFARTGNTVGKTYLHTSGKMIYAGYLIRYKLDETCVLPKFLLAYTHTSLFWDWVSKMKKVGAQPNISAQQYNELPIPRAEIASQQRFVSIAEQADKSKYYEINET